jgi:hypothetical protein
MTEKNKIEICAEIKRETDMAYLVSDGDQDQWLPKSQVEMDSEGESVGPGDTVVFTMPEWLAIEKGFV